MTTMENTAGYSQTMKINTLINERSIPYDKCVIIVNNKHVLVDEHGSLFSRTTEDAIDVIKCEVVRNTIKHNDDISFSGANHKTYNYYTQMYEPYRYIYQHFICVENLARKFKFICGNINLYNETLETNNNPDEIHKFVNTFNAALIDVRQLHEYYKYIVDNQTFLCYENSGDIIDNAYINDLNRILEIGLNISIRRFSNNCVLVEQFKIDANTLLNLCIKVLMTLEPRKIHSLVIA